MAGVVYKPSTRKGPVLLSPNKYDAPTITLADGRVITGVPADQRGGVFYGHEGYQWVFDNDVLGQEGATLRYGGKEQQLGNTNYSYRGGDIGSLSESMKGAVGGTGGPANFEPGQMGDFGSYPGYIGGMFPNPTFSQYDPIQTAPYKFTDVMEFAKSFGEFNRGEMLKNYDLSKGLALDTLDTELAALRGFVPAASALKRSETAIDNIFNQMQRTQQVDATLPTARGDMNAQRDRAATLAEGRLPSSIEDRALEVSMRSAAADRAAAGGFGVESSAARKASDLLSAEERLKVSEYGDRLLSSNLTQQANLFLAPTEYSNAGSQINVNPSISPAALINQEFNRMNELTTVSPTNALQTEVQQQQFSTNLEQQNRQFNASNTLQNNQFNATSANNFALSRFNYDAAYANAVSAANQLDINAQLALQQQQQYQDIFKNYLGQAQNSGQISAIAGLIGTLFGNGNVAGIIGDLAEFFGITGGDESKTPTPETSPGGTGTSPGAGQVVVPPGSEPPPNYTPVGTDSSGGTIYAPNEVAAPSPTQTLEPAPGQDEVVPPPRPPESWTVDENGDNTYTTQSARLAPELQASLKSFSSSTGIPLKTFDGKSAAQIQGMAKAANGVLQSAGISNTPSNGMVQAGVDNSGNPVYVSKALYNSNNVKAGSGVSDTLKKVLDPLGVLTSKDSSALDKIGAIASDVAFIDNLNRAHQNGDTKAFTNMILNRFGYPLALSQVENPDNRAGVAAAFTAYNMFNNWDRMSNTQKGLGLANLGIQGFKFGTGYDLGAQPIIEATYDAAGKLVDPGINVGQALSLLGAGYNAYNLIDNWDQYSTIQKVAGAAGSASQMAGIAKELGLLKEGSSVANVLGTAGGVAGVALGAKAVADGWGQGGTRGAVQGGLGGASIVTGLSMLGYSNPYTAAAIIATSVIGNAVQVGKSKDQGARDSVRSHFKENGLVNGEYKIELPDGSTANIGIDGHGGQHDFTNPDLAVGKKRKLNSWDVDYTNDLDYISGMAGIGLARMVGGGAEKAVDQLGNQLGNAGLGKLGFGQKLTKENFDTVMQNQRAMYAKAGIKSKADAYGLSVELLKQGRISQIDAVQMQQAANMMYDNNGYETAQKLMNGRQRGVEVAHQEADKPKPQRVTMETTGRTDFDPRNIPGADKGRTINTVSEKRKTPALVQEAQRRVAAGEGKPAAPKKNYDRNAFKFLGKQEVIEANKKKGIEGWRPNRN
jgi:hypothetical protein